MSKHKRQPPKTIVVDGLEGEQTRLEDAPGQTHDRPTWTLPEGLREGDVLREVDGKLEIDHEETKRLERKAQGRLDQVNEKHPAGDIDL